MDARAASGFVDIVEHAIGHKHASTYFGVGFRETLEPPEPVPVLEPFELLGDEPWNSGFSLAHVIFDRIL